MYLLDSNTCIQYLNGKSTNIRLRLTGTKPSLIKLCSIVKAELWYGASRSRNVSAALVKLDVFFKPYESMHFDDPAAAEYGRIRGYLEEAGTPIGSNDLMIAAIAWEHQLTLVTHNIREFSRVPGLVVEDWE